MSSKAFLKAFEPLIDVCHCSLYWTLKPEQSRNIACMHARMHAHTHMQARTNAHAHTNAHIRMHTHACTHARTHTYPQAFLS